MPSQDQLAFEAHPKDQQEAFVDSALLRQEVYAAFNAPSGSAAQKATLSEVQAQLQSMTPVERMDTMQNLQGDQRRAEHDNLQTDKSLIGDLPQPKLELDSNGDLKSVTFKTVHQNSSQDQTLTVSLDQRRTTEATGAEEIKRADGSPIAVQYDAKHNITSIKIPDGNLYERQKDGTYTYGDGVESKAGLTDLSVSTDGRITYSLNVAPGIVSKFTDSVAANGDHSIEAVASSATQHHDLLTTEHVEYPPDLQSLKQTTTVLDGKPGVTETTSTDWDGVAIIDRGNMRIVRELNDVTIEPMIAVGGERIPSGTLVYKPSFDDRGVATGGTEYVTFPDGFKKTYPIDAREMQAVQNTNDISVAWATVNGDPHHFHYKVN
jgi:YD repeat-containing protein